jgi:hypothetical protein
VKAMLRVNPKPDLDNANVGMQAKIFHFTSFYWRPQLNEVFVLKQFENGNRKIKT